MTTHSLTSSDRLNYTTPVFNQSSIIFLLILLAITTIVSVCNTLLPADHSLYVSTYTVTLIGKYLTYALLAVAVDLVWGYLGILSLGHGAFFALGGYAMGMYLMRQIGDRGVYGDPILPDFMVFLNWSELPWFWLGFDQFWFAAIIIILAPGALAFLFGWFAFRSRVTGVYLSIISQALTYALMLYFFLNEAGFGGNNGLTDFKDLLGYELQQQSTRVGLFIASALALGIGFIVCRYVVTSKLGRVSMAIRDAESRTRFIGYRVDYYKLFIFTLSAVLAGIAGALYVPQVGIINPSEFSPLNSIEVVVWVALGGRATLYGAVLGAMIVNYAKSYFTVAWPEFWLFALGGLFVVSTVFFPKGIAGLLVRPNKLNSSTPAKKEEKETLSPTNKTQEDDA